MDNPLLTIATNPANTIADVIAALEAIDGLLPDTDGLKWFNWLYLSVTQAVEARVVSGGFTDPCLLYTSRCV